MKQMRHISLLIGICQALNAQHVDYVIQKGSVELRDQLKQLYLSVARTPGVLARNADEITDVYIDEVLSAAIARGILYVAMHDDMLVGALLLYTYEAKSFSHVLTETTIIVDPGFQRQGIGTALLKTLLREVSDHRPDILRIEINTRSSNPAQHLYERLGFVKEFEAKQRMRSASGDLESDIFMVWRNPNFKPEFRKNEQ